MTKSGITIARLTVLTAVAASLQGCWSSNEAWAAALAECRVYEEEYRHPITGDWFDRSVHGVDADTCHVEEHMPGDAMLECHYTLARMPAIADYYANADKYKNFKVNMQTYFVDGEPVTKNVYTLDGEPFDHPLDEALTAGECVVSRY